LAANIGSTHSKEHRARISRALKGKPKSAEHNAKVSAALKGRPGVRRGYTNSPEMREKQRAAAIGRLHTAETREKIVRFYATLTPEQRSARAHKAWKTKRLKQGAAQQQN